MPSEDEGQIDAKLKEIDANIADLQEQRRHLVQAKSALTKSKATEKSPEQPQPPEFSEKALTKALDMLEWTEFKKKEGEWAFLRTRNGELVEDLKPIVDFIDQLRHGKRLTVGRYDYVASEDKFLNRYLRPLDRS